MLQDNPGSDSDTGTVYGPLLVTADALAEVLMQTEWFAQLRAEMDAAS